MKDIEQMSDHELLMELVKEKRRNDKLRYVKYGVYGVIALVVVILCIKYVPKIVEFFKEICSTYKGVSYSLRYPGGNCIRFIDVDKDLCFDTAKSKYTDVVLEVSKVINKLKLKKREG